MFGKTIIALALVSLVALSADADADSGPMLQKLCSGSKDAPQVTHISEVKAMIELLQAGEDSGCSEQTKEAILKLGPVVALSNVCSKEAADVIVDYWMDYGETSSELRKNLPKPLRKFFRAFGLQMSKHCKRALIDELEKATHDSKITEEDFELVSRPMIEKVDVCFGKDDKRIENLLAIMDAKPYEGEKSRVMLKPLRKRHLELVQERCAKKFKPVYDTLISPLVRLAAIGLSYKGEPIATDLLKFQTSQLYVDWFTAVMTCESKFKFQAILGSSVTLDAFGIAREAAFLDEDEVKELERQTGLDLTEPEVVEQVEDYKAVGAKLDDLVLDESDTSLVKAASKYKNTLSETNKLRVRLLTRLPKMLISIVGPETVTFGMAPVNKKVAVSKRSKILKSVLHAAKVLIVLTILGGLIAASVAVIIATHGAAIPITIIAALWLGAIVGLALGMERG